MRLVFAGTPRFAATALEALIRSEHQVALVMTRPDAAAGRGLKTVPSEVKRLAIEHGLAVFQPVGLRDPAAVEQVRGCGADVMVVAAYGLILPRSVLAAFPRGCINIHASVLPRWRGAAPIQRAIEAGDPATGLCLMQMEAGLDTGPVLARWELPIDAEATGGSLHDELASGGAERLPGWLRALAAGQLKPQPQDAALATYAHKLSRDDARIDWSADAETLARRVRAFNPWPVAHTTLDGNGLRLWFARALDATAGEPGRVLEVRDDGLIVACGRGALLVTELQFAGGRRLAAAEAARGRTLQGVTLGR